MAFGPGGQEAMIPSDDLSEAPGDLQGLPLCVDPEYR